MLVGEAGRREQCVSAADRPSGRTVIHHPSWQSGSFADRFNSMPFTPYDAATDSLDRARAMLSGARAAGTVTIRRPRGGRLHRVARLSTAVRSDMRRLSVVMAVAALDTYMHRLIVDRAYTHGDELPGRLARLDVPFAQLLAQADDARAAARREPHNSRPRVGVKRQLRDRLLRERFQSYESVRQALGMAGLSGTLPFAGAQMAPPMQTTDIKYRLDAIVVRRNQIVHEGDYERLEKPQTAKLLPMSQTQATADIEFIAQLVDAIHAVI